MDMQKENVGSVICLQYSPEIALHTGGPKTAVNYVVKKRDGIRKQKDKSYLQIMSKKYFHCAYWHQKLKVNRANACYILKRNALLKEPQA